MIRQRGFTIIELMVGLTLSLIIAFATSAIYLQTKQMFRTQSAQSQLEEQGRYAITLFQHILGQSGYRAVGSTLEGLPLATAYPALGKFGAGDTIHEVNGILYTRSTGDTDGNILRCDGSSAPKYPSLVSTTVTTFGLQISGGNLTCSSDATTGGTTLINSQTQVSNIVSSSFTYGLDNDGDRIPDTQSNYPRVPASSLTTNAQWASVYSVQVCLVIASDNDGITTDSQSYLPCGNGSSATNLLPMVPTTDHRLYRRFVTTIYLRNRLDFS